MTSTTRVNTEYPENRERRDNENSGWRSWFGLDNNNKKDQDDREYKFERTYTSRTNEPGFSTEYNPDSTYKYSERRFPEMTNYKNYNREYNYERPSTEYYRGEYNRPTDYTRSMMSTRPFWGMENNRTTPYYGTEYTRPYYGQETTRPYGPEPRPFGPEPRPYNYTSTEMKPYFDRSYNTERDNTYTRTERDNTYTRPYNMERENTCTRPYNMERENTCTRPYNMERENTYTRQYNNERDNYYTRPTERDSYTRDSNTMSYGYGREYPTTYPTRF